MRTTALLIVIVSVLIILHRLALAEPPRVELELAPRSALCDGDRDPRFNRLGQLIAARVCHAAAIDLATRAIELATGAGMPRALARARDAACDVRCWFDRPTSIIADVGLDPESWPAPPAHPPGRWWLFFLAAPDLDDRWYWVAVRERVSDSGSTRVVVWSDR